MDIPKSILIYIIVPIIPIVIGLVLEHYLSIIQRFKIIKAILLNDSAKLDLLVWFESSEYFDKIKKELIDMSGNEGKLDKVSIDSENKLELKLTDFNIVVTEHSPGIYIFRTENISTGIRDLKQETQSAIDILSNLREKLKDTTFKDISLDLYLPYKSNYIPNINIRNYRLEDYKASYVSEKFKSHIELNLKKLSITNIKLENIISVVGNFITLL